MTAFLLRLTTWLPRPLRQFASEARIRLLVQFGMFGVVGLIGFAIDTATVYSILYVWRRVTGLGQATLPALYVAGLAAYFIAATGTWLCNRLWTFRHAVSTYSWYVQWRNFLTANLGGFAINRGLYFFLVTYVEAAHRQPVLAIFAGALGGMMLNFNLSRKLVFR